LIANDDVVEPLGEPLAKHVVVAAAVAEVLARHADVDVRNLRANSGDTVAGRRVVEQLQTVIRVVLLLEAANGDHRVVYRLIVQHGDQHSGVTACVHVVVEHGERGTVVDRIHRTTR
jgi:hypothetical protein